MTVNLAALELEKKVLADAKMNYRVKKERKGQALMNALRHEAPELYDIVTGTEIDCFYKDESVDALFEELGFNKRTF